MKNYFRRTRLNQLFTRLQASRLEMVSFFTGFGLLSYELAAARILAPSIGSSTYVWTSVIGVIIAALSFGFFVGGRLADSRRKLSDIGLLLLVAAIMVVFTLVAYDGLLENVTLWFDDRRLQAIAAALLLFAPASFLIGCTSPYLAKLKVSSLSATGRSIASLDSFNAIGGIVGTFVTGFILFGYIGSRETLIAVAILLLASSWLFVWSYRTGLRLLLSALLLLTVGLPAAQVGATASIDTPSAHYKVIEGMYEGRGVIGLATGPSGTQSAVYSDGTSDPVFWYTREMARLTIQQAPERILVLGGGAFTLPQYLAEQLPGSQIDVVEIDPELQAISETYFNYRNPANISLIFDDARTFINETTNRYDVVLVDVYGDTAIPFSLMTKQYGEGLARLVAPHGLLAVNLIAGDKGPCLEVFSAVHAAYTPQFTYSRYAPQPGRNEGRRNNILMYSREPLAEPGYRSLPVNQQAPYTDDYAPAERLYFACQQSDR